MLKDILPHRSRCSFTYYSLEYRKTFGFEIFFERRGENLGIVQIICERAEDVARQYDLNSDEKDIVVKWFINEVKARPSLRREILGRCQEGEGVLCH